MTTVYIINVEPLPLQQDKKKDIAITITITTSQDIRDLCRGFSYMKIEGLEFDDFKTDKIMKMQQDTAESINKVSS